MPQCQHQDDPGMLTPWTASMWVLGWASQPAVKSFLPGNCWGAKHVPVVWPQSLSTTQSAAQCWSFSPCICVPFSPMRFPNWVSNMQWKRSAILVSHRGTQPTPVAWPPFTWLPIMTWFGAALHRTPGWVQSCCCRLQRGWSSWWPSQGSACCHSPSRSLLRGSHQLSVSAKSTKVMAAQLGSRNEVTAGFKVGCWLDNGSNLKYIFQ